jgi:hypothetical protein
LLGLFSVLGPSTWAERAGGTLYRIALAPAATVGIIGFLLEPLAIHHPTIRCMLPMLNRLALVFVLALLVTRLWLPILR